MKRTFDVVVALGMLMLFLPLGCLLALCILLESRGGVFYRQERIGLHGKPFKLLKFRSMRPKADLEGKLTVGERDPRITRIGYVIRKVKLDEFPQFLNVLMGEMSVVGPRPEVAEYVNKYNEAQRKVLDYKPGITDVASLKYFEENKLLAQSTDPERTYLEEIMPEKIRINLEYQRSASVLSDVHVVINTALRLFQPKNVRRHQS
ncbi:MAG: sugar transferase [Flavobacteriia bacterium]|nr:sugar transferase [Flavobacteriia bacterium]